RQFRSWDIRQISEHVKVNRPALLEGTDGEVFKIFIPLPHSLHPVFEVLRSFIQRYLLLLVGQRNELMTLTKVPIHQVTEPFAFGKRQSSGLRGAIRTFSGTFLLVRWLQDRCMDELLQLRQRRVFHDFRNIRAPYCLQSPWILPSLVNPPSVTF